MKRLAAEFLGTFILEFAGTGAIIVNDVSGGAVSHVGVALKFGLVCSPQPSDRHYDGLNGSIPTRKAASGFSRSPDGSSSQRADS